MSNIKFIVYQSHWENSEVLVTTPELEKEFVEEWFGEGSDRYFGDYDRTEHNETGIRISSNSLRLM